MRLTAPLVFCALSSTALANPCGKAPATDLTIVDSWQAVHAHLNAGKHPTATVAAATADLCSGAGTGRPCDPTAPISVVSDHYGSTVALALRNPNDSYAVVTLPVVVPPYVHHLTMQSLAKDVVHINVRWEDIGREMWCEDEDRDKDGECREGRTASVVLGETYIDILVNPIARTVRWRSECSVEGNDTPSRVSTIVRDAAGTLGYVDCNPALDPQWFAFKGGKCVPAASPVDMAATLKAARTASKAGDFKRALAGFDTLLATSPGRTTYLSERGFVRYKAGELAGAEADLKAALQTAPAKSLAGIIWFNRGLVSAAKGDTKSALDAFETANRMRPSKAAQAKIAALKAAAQK